MPEMIHNYCCHTIGSHIQMFKASAYIKIIYEYHLNYVQRNKFCTHTISTHCAGERLVNLLGTLWVVLSRVPLYKVGLVWAWD